MKSISVTKNGKITGGKREGTCTNEPYCRAVKRCADTIRYVLTENINPEQSCLIPTLISAAIGFIVGFVSWPNGRGARLSTVMAARYAANYASSSTVSKLPRLPCGVFLSLPYWPWQFHFSRTGVRFSLVTFSLLLRWRRPGFRAGHGCLRHWLHRARQKYKEKHASKSSFLPHPEANRVPIRISKNSLFG
jgi:hypothetical protein